MNHVLALRLTEAGVQLTTDFYGPGTHSWPYWERELHRSLPLLLCALGSDQECQAAAASARAAAPIPETTPAPLPPGQNTLSRG